MTRIAKPTHNSVAAGKLVEKIDNLDIKLAEKKATLDEQFDKLKYEAVQSVPGEVRQIYLRMLNDNLSPVDIDTSEFRA